MIKKIMHKKVWLIPLALLSIMVLIWQSASSDEIKWISIGMLHNWFSSGGCEIEVGRRHLVADQQDGLIWPANYKYQDIQAAKGLWIGTKNFFDPIAGKTFDFKVVHIGPRVFDENNEFMPKRFDYYGKFNHPVVTVDGTLASQLVYRDELTDVDPSLKADRMIYNVVITSLGLEVTRKIYAFSNEYYDDFHIFEYIFKNTGVYKKDGSTMNPIPTLKDVVIMFQYRYAPTRYASVYGYYYAPQSAAWGHNTLNHVLHPDIGTSPDGQIRGFYAWHGKHSKYVIPNPPGGDNYGGPNIGSSRKEADGFLGAAQFPGIVVLHADKSTTDKSDDPSQPFSTPFFSSDAEFTSGNDQFNAPRMQTEYEKVMLMGLMYPTHAQRVGDNFADQYIPPLATGNPGGVSQGLSFGPYDIGPGEEIRIVLAEAVGGLSRQMCREIGYKWWKQITPYVLPDGSTTTNGNDFKNAWVFTGKDSVVQTFKRAIHAWQNNLVIDEPPPPPDKFEVISGGDRITLKWSNSAESYPHFGGYRIYRAIHTPDTTFELIYECGQGTGKPLVHEYEDKTPQRGFNYYYYITSFDDGTVNTVKPGQRLESSMFWTRTSEPAYLRRPAGKALDQIRIVPNPYQIRNIDYQFGESAPDRIMFFNIPPKCVIKIFTESGELINTIYHTNGSGDEEWNLITSSRQVIVSGIYIAYFEVLEDYYDPDDPTKLLFKKGDSTYQKFVVIR